MLGWKGGKLLGERGGGGESVGERGGRGVAVGGREIQVMFATLLEKKDVDTCLATLRRLSVTAGVGDTGGLSPTLTTLSTYDGHYRCQGTRGGRRCGGMAEHERETKGRQRDTLNGKMAQDCL